MNKFFVFALLALVAVCAAAPSEEIPSEEILNPVESADAKNLEGHDQDKRSIYLGMSGYRYYPYYRNLGATYPTYPLTYPSLSWRMFI